MELTREMLKAARAAGACSESLKRLRVGKDVLAQVSHDDAYWCEQYMPAACAEVARQALCDTHTLLLVLAPVLVSMLVQCGYGCGSGFGSGSGYGYGDVYGDGYGYGSGYGDGYGFASGSGYGYGYGDGYGDGDGYGGSERGNA